MGTLELVRAACIGVSKNLKLPIFKDFKKETRCAHFPEKLCTTESLKHSLLLSTNPINQQSNTRKDSLTLEHAFTLIVRL